MAEYHVGCGIAGIYAGTFRKEGTWSNKSLVTDEAIRAVRDWMVMDCLRSSNIIDKEGYYEWTRTDGKRVQLVVRIKEREATKGDDTV